MMRRVGLLAIAVTVAGCLSGEYTPIRTYMVDAVPQVMEAEPTEKALGIRDIESVAACRGGIAYLEPGNLVGHHEYAEWCDLPERIVTRALLDALVATKRFADVGRASDMPLPDLILTGTLRRFYEDHTTEPWEAVCEVRLEVRDTSSRELRWADTVMARVPLAEDDVKALPTAMSEALGQVATQVATEIAAL